MEVTVQFTARKQALFHKYLEQRLREKAGFLGFLRFINLYLAVAVGLAFLATALLIFTIPMPKRLWFALVLLVLPAVLACMLKYYRRKLAKIMDEPTGFQHAAARYLIEDGNITITRRGSTERIVWAEFERVVKTPALIIVHVDAMSAFYIGREDFARSEDYDAFYNALNAKIPARAPVKT